VRPEVALAEVVQPVVIGVAELWVRADHVLEVVGQPVSVTVLVDPVGPESLDHRPSS
jgi:hypothetical protein